MWPWEFCTTAGFGSGVPKQLDWGTWSLGFCLCTQSVRKSHCIKKRNALASPQSCTRWHTVPMILFLKVKIRIVTGQWVHCPQPIKSKKTLLAGLLVSAAGSISVQFIHPWWWDLRLCIKRVWNCLIKINVEWMGTRTCEIDSIPPQRSFKDSQWENLDTPSSWKHCFLRNLTHQYHDWKLGTRTLQQSCWSSRQIAKMAVG